MELKNKHKGHNVIDKKVVGFDTKWCEDCQIIVSYIKPENTKKQKKRKINIDISTTELTEVILHEKKFNLKVDTIYNEKEEETIKRMSDGYVDYTITSPPYNIYQDSDKAIKKTKVGKYSKLTDNMSQEEYFLWQVKIINSLLRVTKKHVFYNIQIVANNKIAVLSLIYHFKDKLKDIVIWNKEYANPNMQKGILNSGYEFILIFSNDNPEIKVFKGANWSSGKLSNSIIIGRRTKVITKDNNATYPLNLPKWIISNFCKKGELIYDPYMGTGTTALACKLKELHYIGSEIDEEQIKFSNRRIKERQTELHLK